MDGGCCRCCDHPFWLFLQTSVEDPRRIALPDDPVCGDFVFVRDRRAGRHQPRCRDRYNRLSCDYRMLDRRRRFQLQCGALLHDIGWVEGQKGHHKAALRLTVAEPGLAFDPAERLIVGLIARYHRKALPKPRHQYMDQLGPEDRDVVEKLAAILRIADGLDRTHTNIVSDTDCRFDEKTITIRARAQGPATAEIETADRKADLMRRAFGRGVNIVTSGPGTDA